jgi:aminoglycoside 2'-N-acetyltransferase I
MTELVVAHTGQLDAAVLRAGRDLLQDVFAGELTDDDWEHCLGGLHALLWEDGELIGHAALIQRRLLHGGRSLRTGYVEGVGVRADRRRRGHGATVMEALEQVARRAYDVAALGATDEATAFYESRGWRLWRGPTSALTPDGVVRTEEEDDCIYVLPLSAPLDLHGALTCDWRNGDAW